jgi:riboflavin kinase/FMN adenylyltransferase
MEIYNKLADLKSKYPKLVVALGMFDGVHTGHQSIIQRAVELAQKIGGKSLVFTFSNHPLSVLAPDRMPPQIGNNFLRQARLEALGVDVLMNIPFTRAFSQVSPEDFLLLLQAHFAPRYVVTGANYTFGERGRGTQRLLLRAGKDYGFEAEICPTVLQDGKPVSSTRIREFIQSGDLASANTFLGYPLTMIERVQHGDKRGRLLGFPTANLAIGKNRAILPKGVYAALAIYDSQPYAALANIGNNPTFEGERAVRIEVNIQDFNKNIYDQMLTVQFLQLLRPEKKFASVEQLVKQMHRDKEAARSIWLKKNSK